MQKQAMPTHRVTELSLQQQQIGPNYTGTRDEKHSHFLSSSRWTKSESLLCVIKISLT